MLRRLSDWLISSYYRSKSSDYEIVFEEFMSGELFGIEGNLTRLRRYGILLYAIYLAISTKNLIISYPDYLLVLGIFAALHPASYFLKKFDPRFSVRHHRILRFHLYLPLVALLIFLARGADSHLLLFSPYLLFTGIYISPIWSGILTVEATLLTIEAYYYLAAHDFAVYSPTQILLRGIAVFIAGGMATYLWYRQYHSRVTLLRQDRELAKITTILTSTFDLETIKAKTIDLLKRLLKVGRGMVLTDDDHDGIYTVFVYWGYPGKPDYSYKPSAMNDEGFTGWVLLRKQTLLVQDTQRRGNISKYPEVAGQIQRSYLGVPLLVGDVVVGVLRLTSSRLNQFGYRHQRLLERVGLLLAISLRNTQVVKEIIATRDYYDQLLDGVLDAMIVADRTGKVQRMNKPARELLGYQPNEIQNLTVDQCWSGPVEARHILSLMYDGGGQVRDYEGKVKTKSGKLIPILFSGTMIIDFEGNCQATVGYFREISDYLTIRKELAAWEDINKIIAEAVQHPDLYSLTHTFLKGAAGLIGTDSWHIRLVDESGCFLDLIDSSIGPYSKGAVARKKWGEAVSGEVIEHSRDVICQNTQKDPYTLATLTKYPNTPLEDFLRKYLSYMVVPLLAGGEAIGSLHTESQTTHFFTKDRQGFMHQLANRIAPAIQNARLRQLADEQMEKLQLLAESTQMLLYPPSIEDLYKLVVRQGQDLLNAEDCSLYIVDPVWKNIRLVASSTLPPEIWGENPTPISAESKAGLPAYVAATGQNLKFTGDEYKKHPAWQGQYVKHLDFLPSRGCRALMLASVQDIYKPDYPALGVLKVENKQDGGPLQAFSQADMERLLTLANHFAGILKQINLREHAQQRIQQLSILQDASVAIQAEQSLERQLFYVLIAITIKDSLAFNRGMIFLVDKYGGHLRGECAIGPEDEADAKRIYEDTLWQEPITRELILDLFERYHPLYQEASLHQFVRTLQFPLREDRENILVETTMQGSTPARVITTNDLPDDEFCVTLKDKHLQAEEFVLVPLVAQDKVIGVLYFDNRFNYKKINEDNLGLLQLFASQLGAVIANTHMMQERERIFYEVAHTIGTPITTIAGFAERLVDKDFQNETEWQEYIEFIASSAEYLKTATNEALYLTYLERMAEPLKFDWVSIEWFYKSLLNLNRFKLRERGIEIINNSVQEPIEVHVDRNLMLTAVQTLVDNAIKFSDDNQRIWFGAIPVADDKIVIEIKDEGIGIPPDELPFIWDSYFRGRYAEQKQTGTGSGLQLAKRIIEAQHSQIDVTSQLGSGSIFSILLSKESWRYQKTSKNKE